MDIAKDIVAIKEAALTGDVRAIKALFKIRQALLIAEDNSR
jgi:hypothetical protein